MAKSVNDITSTTQQYLDIYDVSNDFLILKDGSTSLILTVSAMNFGLLAEEEQDAIMYAYAGLLNSLNYPIQIVIRSQTKDVTSYLQLLKDEEDKTVSDTRRNWIARYRQFVGELIKERNVLDKKFYVAIPASNLEMGLLPPSTVVPGVKQIDISKIERSVILEKAREILEPKRDYLIAQFGRIGLQSRQLTTQEIIQFFYLSYNPEAAEGQQITDTNSYTTAMVQASMQGGFMDNVTTQPMATPPASGANPMAQQPDTTQSAPMAAVTQTSMPQPQVNPADVIGNGGSVSPDTMATPAPMAAPVDAAVQPHASNMSAPATPSMPVTPVMPAMETTPDMPVAPAMTTPQAMPTDVAMTSSPTKTDDIQNEINSTLQELGQPDSGSQTIPATPSMPIPPVTATAPSMTTPPVMPPQPSAPITPSMPVEPAVTSASQPATGAAPVTPQTPQVLPEI